MITLLKKPLIYLFIIIGNSIYNMTCIGIHCKFHISAAGFQLIDHCINRLKRCCSIFIAMECPNRKIFNFTYIFRVVMGATNGNDGCQPVGIINSKIPCATSPQTRTGKINPICICIIFCNDFIYKIGNQLMRPCIIFTGDTVA